MKKAAIIFVFVQLFFTPLVFGAAITDSVEPLGDMKYSVSYEDNFIFDRDLETSGTTTDAEVDATHQSYGKITVGLMEHFNVYTKLGASTQSDYKFVRPAIFEYETDAGFLWGLGASGAYKFSEGWKVAGDIQYNAWTADVDKVRYVGESASNIKNPEITNQEFQVSGVILKDFEISDWKTVVTPYVGVSYLYFDTESDGTITFDIPSSATSISDNWSVEGDDIINVIVGINAKAEENWNLYVEGRFIAETAISGGLTYAF